VEIILIINGRSSTSRKTSNSRTRIRSSIRRGYGNRTFACGIHSHNMPVRSMCCGFDTSSTSGWRATKASKAINCSTVYAKNTSIKCNISSKSRYNAIVR
jgi:hypothetical protein